jgi:hypothetical protein
MRISKRWRRATLVTLGLLACAVVPLRLLAQDPLHWGRNEAGDSRPILVNADDVATWQDQGKRIFLLKGKVYFEQGDASVRLPQAVLWVDEDLKKQSGVYHLEFYGDGGVFLEVQSKSYSGPWGLFEMNTRGDIKLKSFKTKVQVKTQPDDQDPLYQRAVAARSGQRSPADGPQPAPSSQAGKPATTLPLDQNSKPAAPQFDPLLQRTSAQLPAADLPLQTPPGNASQVVQPPTTFPPGPPGSPGSPMPAPVVPAPPPGVGAVPPQPGAAAPVEGPPRHFSIRPRSSQRLEYREFQMQNGEKAVIFSPGVIISVDAVDPKDRIDIEADRVVAWTHGNGRDLVEGTAAAPDQQGHKPEFYLSGNVEIRSLSGKEVRTLRCNEAYYDINRNVAIALDADLEIQQPGLPDKLHVRGPEIDQLNKKLTQFGPTGVNASKLPYGPGLEVTVSEGTLEQKHVPKYTIFDLPVFKRGTGEQEYEDQLIFKGTNVITHLEGIPVFYLPYLQGDVRDPLGPLQSVGLGYSRVFGFQFFTTWNMYDLLGIDPAGDTRWRLDVDELSSRGPQIGTEYLARGKDLFGIPSKYNFTLEARGIYDTGLDILGGNRGQIVVFPYPPPTIALPITHPNGRGRLFEELNWQDLPQGFTVQTQFAGISDKNYLDQYFNPLWVNGLNQETFIYVKQQQNNWAWTALVEPNLRNWITEGQWFPKIDGHWIGQDFFNLFSYSASASAGLGILQVTHQPPPPFEPTDFNDTTGRFDLFQKLALPFQAGPFKLVPYGVADFTYYSNDIDGSSEDRILAGAGILGSIPFSRLYPDIESELLNLHTIYHKIVVSGNYQWLHSDASHLLFPQLDRLNDDETDQTLRDIRPLQPVLNPTNAVLLNSGFFDPQLFALRKLVENRIDTRDSIEEVQLDIRQRLQTKRGFPGQEHIVDWMTLDVQFSFFPQPSQNFGSTIGFIEYDWTWNIGDRTALFSSGWFDPQSGGGRTFNIGATTSRPDRTTLTLNYRQIDPLDSKAVIGSIVLPFSSKYSLTASSAYDFGVNTQINTLSVTRYGTDLLVTFGITYNSILNNLGVIFEIFPNLVPENKRVPVGQGLQSLAQGKQ